MGGGKSLINVQLTENWGVKNGLILCPLAVLPVWRREFAKHAATSPRVLVLEGGSVAEKTEAADRFLKQGPGIVAINYDSARAEAFAKWSTKRRWDLVTLDESHRAKSASGKTSKLVHALGRLAGHRLCLSGTPMPHSPLDIYGQYRFAAPGIFGPSYVRFRSRYAITDKMFPSKVLRYINQEEFAEKVGKLIYRVDNSVLDLPQAMHETRTFELCPKARRAYRELEQDLITEVDSGTVTVSNALVKLLRLQQITSGYLPVEGGRGERIDMGKEALLADFLDDLPSNEPVVVFCRFRSDLDCVRQAAATLRRRYGELSGQRRDLTEHAMMRDDVDVMGVQIQSGGVGVDFTRAAYAVYFSVNWALGDYDQSLARLHRPGQNRPVRYYHLLARDTVDEKVYKAFDTKREIIETVLSSLSGRYAA
jgi:SNF2 family DNA or RNA helicase